MLTVLFLGLLVAANASILPSIPRFGERIVGGSPIDITDVPYQVALLVNRGSGTFSQYCGGTIITQRVVLTAAQCTDGYARTQLRIRVGSVVHNTGGQVLEVSKITQHTGYTNALDNDISLLVLPTYLELSSSIALATLPYQSESVAVGSAATVTGWGSLSEGGSASLNLNKVTIPIVNQQLCINSYTEFNTVTSNMICAGYISTGGADSCQGDTGGPLTVGGTLVGIASWARGCALAGYPGVYTRVTEYVTWIKENSSV